MTTPESASTGDPAAGAGPRSGIGTDDATTPAPAQPGPLTEAPKTEAPKIEKPGTEKPGTEKPGTEKPGTEKPGTEAPESPSPVAEAGSSPAAEELGDAARPGVGEVTATVIVNAPAERVFTALLAWERQSEWIPFTRVRLVDGDGGEGSSVEAVTQIGPAVVRDEMRVIKVDPPYEVRVVHYGKVLRGPGSLRCTPMGDDRTQVVWHEWFHLPGGAAGKVAWPVLWPGSKVSLTQALRRFARMVEAGGLP